VKNGRVNELGEMMDSGSQSVEIHVSYGGPLNKMFLLSSLILSFP
jgi:hypothetical protein